MNSNDDLIDDSDFEPFFSREEMVEQHCHLLQAEAAELSTELREARRKIATLVLMWSGVTKELAEVKKDLHDAKWTLSAAYLELSNIATSKMVQGHRPHNPEASG
jgi:hypothetical protein